MDRRFLSFRLQLPPSSQLHLSISLRQQCMLGVDELVVSYRSQIVNIASPHNECNPKDFCSRANSSDIVA